MIVGTPGDRAALFGPLGCAFTAVVRTPGPHTLFLNIRRAGEEEGRTWPDRGINLCFATMAVMRKDAGLVGIRRQSARCTRRVT